MKKFFVQYGLFFACLITSYTGESQNPIFSATQNWLDQVNQNTCMQRARETMLKNGFSAIQQSDNVSYIGSKTAYNAYITCQSCQDKVIATIVLSTSWNVDEATQLRELMLRYIATGKDDIFIPVSVVNIVTNKNNFTTTEKIMVDYSGMAGNVQDWISLTPKGKPDNEFGPWKYTEGKKSGSLIFDPLPAGEYEVRAYFNNGYKVEKRYSFVVQGTNPVIINPVSGKFLKLNKVQFTIGEKLNVQYFNLPGNATDWIAIAEAGKPETQYQQWLQTGGKKEGLMPFNGLPEGNYEARLFFSNSYKLEEKLDFKVIPPPDEDFIIKTDKTVFAEKETIKVLFSNSLGMEADWVSVCTSGTTDNQFGQWFYRGALSSGEMSFTGLTAGNYEIRYYLNNGYEIKKRIPIKVIK